MRLERIELSTSPVSRAHDEEEGKGSPEIAVEGPSRDIMSPPEESDPSLGALQSGGSGAIEVMEDSAIESEAVITQVNESLMEARTNENDSIDSANSEDAVLTQDEIDLESRRIRGNDAYINAQPTEFRVRKSFKHISS